VSPDQAPLTVPAAMRRREFAAMGTTVTVVTGAAAADQAGDEVQRLFAEWERRLSRFQPDSELSRLNARSGQPVAVSKLLFGVLSAGLRAAHATAGLYDPTLLRALEHLGYDRSFEQLTDRTPAAQGEVPAGGGWRRVVLEQRTRTVTLPAGVGVDLGGIAKGMAVDAAIDCLRTLGVPAAMVSAGGDLRVHGLPPGLDRWPIAVDGGQGAVTVGLTHGSLATSGIGRRRWRQGRVERHHLLDPRHARPSNSGLWSVTVAAATCGQAEVAAKTAFILGPTAGIAFLDSKHLAGLLVGRSGRCWRCGSWPASPDHQEEAACSPASR
jgi:thiamine biosynthesis lipoprotein